MKMKKILNEWKRFIFSENVHRKNLENMKPDATPYDVAAYFVALALSGNNDEPVLEYFTNEANQTYIGDVLDSPFKYYDLKKSGEMNYLASKRTKSILILKLKDTDIKLKNPPSFDDELQYENALYKLEDMITTQIFNFSVFDTNQSGPYTGRYDFKHSGGASDVGVKIPENASEEDKQFIGTRISKYYDAFDPREENPKKVKFEATKELINAFERLKKVYIDLKVGMKSSEVSDLNDTIKSLQKSLSDFETTDKIPAQDSRTAEEIEYTEASSKVAELQKQFSDLQKLSRERSPEGAQALKDLPMKNQELKDARVAARTAKAKMRAAQRRR